MNIGVFTSSFADVQAEYNRLNDELAPALEQLEDIDDIARDFSSKVLGKLAPSITLPSNAAELDADTASLLLERFAAAIARPLLAPQRQLLSAGDAAFNFSCLVYYALSSRELTPFLRDLVLDTCDVADNRPLPVMRWTSFVRSNIADQLRVRTVMRSCIFSKTLLEPRLSLSIAQLSVALPLKDELHVLAIGTSKTVISGLAGFAKTPNKKVLITSATPSLAPALREAGLSYQIVADDKLWQPNGKPPFDFAVIGCAVVGRTAESEVEVVNWSGDVALAKQARANGVPLIVMSGLYKFWPQRFYEANRDTAVNIQDSASTKNLFLTQRDIDWLVTEYEAVNFRDPQRPQWMRFLFEARSLDVTSGLSLCSNRANIIRQILDKENIYKIDNLLSQLSMNEPDLFERYQRHPEDFEYMATHKLPAQFVAAQAYYYRQIKDPQWFARYEGKYIAVLGGGEGIVTDDTLEGVIHKMYTEWGFRPIFQTRVSAQDRQRICC